MAVESAAWGSVAGREVHRFTVSNARGAVLVGSDYGAAALALHVPAPDGSVADVILGYDRPEGYRAASACAGATVGRVANRIRGGRFTLDGRDYRIAPNEGRNALHGGEVGFHRRVWEAEPDADGVTFRLASPDGDQGFPGTLHASVRYSLTDETVFRIGMRATTDRPTLCNLAHHSYFNLAGHAAGDARGQEVRIDADFYTPVDAETLPTGEVLSVDGTAFDFRHARPVGTAVAYDHNWCLSGEPGRLRRVARASDPASGRGFDLWTTEPGLQFYTGGGLGPGPLGKGGLPLTPFGGYAFESQRFPDAPNLTHFPGPRLDPGEEYSHVMEFRFFT